MHKLILPLLLSVFQPEGSSGYESKEPAFAKEMMVCTNNPHATKAALEILEIGGNALDAAITAQLVLNVVEPQSSGIGGGAFLLYYNARQKKVSFFDGRETAPKEVDEALYFPEGKQISGGKTVGVPGLVAMLDMVHIQEGSLPWEFLFKPAIKIAEVGFPISHRLYTLIMENPGLKKMEAAKDFFFIDDKAKPAGTILKNPFLARAFRLIAEGRSPAFYEGALAEKITRAVQSPENNPGVLSLEDLKNYRAVLRKPITFKYRTHTIVGAPLPSSGGITLAQIMGILEKKPLEGYSLGSPEFINLFCQASRLAYADRNTYLADPAFFPVPQEVLLSKNYIERRAKLLGTKYAFAPVAPGNPPLKIVDGAFNCCEEGDGLDLPSTTHISIIDKEGNAVSMTSSIENAFGSKIFVEGFFLNNQLTDFFNAKSNGEKEVANRIQGGKRPLSSMTPVLVFDKEGRLSLIAGSAGGSRIIDYVAEILFGVLDFTMNVQQAIAFPHFCSMTHGVELEKGTFLEKIIPQLENMSNTVTVLPLNSGSTGIQITPTGIIGGVDPRREGLALGK